MIFSSLLLFYPILLVTLAWIFFRTKTWVNSMEYFSRLFAFSEKGDYSNAWTNLKLGKFREAEVLFNKALMNRPNDKSALEGLELIK